MSKSCFDRLTVADVKREAKKILSTKNGAAKFLKMCGVTFDKHGNTVVTPK